MTSTTARILVIALAVVALVAPPASARPMVRKIPERHAPWRIATDHSNTTPLDYILPGVMLTAMLGAWLAYSRTPRPVRRSPA